MTEKRDDGGAAFPGDHRLMNYAADGTMKPVSGSAGMTLRDWFAGQALIGAGTWTPSAEISGEHVPASLTSLNEHDGRRLRAEWAYAQADAMLDARK